MSLAAGPPFLLCARSDKPCSRWWRGRLQFESDLSLHRQLPWRHPIAVQSMRTGSHHSQAVRIPPTNCWRRTAGPDSLSRLASMLGASKWLAFLFVEVGLRGAPGEMDGHPEQAKDWATVGCSGVPLQGSPWRPSASLTASPRTLNASTVKRMASPGNTTRNGARSMNCVERPNIVPQLASGG